MQAFKQVDVLLVLDQGSIERRYGLAGVAVGKNFVWNIVLAINSFQPVDKF